jgi:uncharacterized protein (TIRG00374 family)
LDDVGSTLRKGNPIYLPGIAALYVLRYWLRSLRWHVLVAHLRDVSPWQALPRVLLSQAANLVLPFQLGYGLMVQISAERFRLGRSQLLGAEAIERMMDGLVFALFLALALATLSIGEGFTGLTAFLLFGTFTGLGLAWFFTRRSPAAPAAHGALEKRFGPRFRTLFLPAFRQGLASIQRWRQARDIFLLTLATWTAEAALYWLVGLSLGLSVNPLVYVFVTAAANTGAGIPLIHSGVGFVFLCQQALVAVGETTTLATAYSLGLEGLLIAPFVILGPASVYWMRLRFRDVFSFGPKRPPVQYAGEGVRPEPPAVPRVHHEAK